MSKLVSIERIRCEPETSATDGTIRWSKKKSVWLVTHAVIGVFGLLLFPQLDALLVFLGLTAITICAGHSVGMHRLLIHRSFETFRWLEYLLVWLGTLVGMAGPIGMIKTHDMRDWHQRQVECPPHPAHEAAFFKDAWWQLCCEFQLASPPSFDLEKRIKDDRIYEWIEKTWMLQQIPIAALLWGLYT